CTGPGPARQGARSGTGPLRLDGSVSSSPPPLLPFRLDAQKLRQLVRIETDDRLAVDQRDRRALISQTQQLFQGIGILAHVFIHELNTLLRKKLFLFMTWPSAGLGKNYDGFRHLSSPCCSTAPRAAPWKDYPAGAFESIPERGEAPAASREK